ncbi:exodeoxyribonuclease VII large subunit [Thermospira aquatica]|uniref:Exodeoxyribonuclease 7 large subunit n=1 Tax=Thermospira aquatica TaxID=2828656 RepID=A0AAX3BC05_9SPIR|nr:exodeoxyribonuclease VII large subunit [Thermospira aquatica]URA09709.1 exodeoxyribonuclease VII large subunit [Thermospira aquatica]
MPQEVLFPDRYFSVSEIGERADEALRGAFPDTFWVRGEITNLSNQKNLDLSKNYIFCSLKDEFSQITLYIPASSPAFKLIPSLKDGIEVYVYGKINYYTKQNSISIRVLDLLISGEGELKRQFELMKKRLLEEGLFDPSHKKPLPRFPRCVGVITSPTGAALQDILNRTQQPHGALDIIVFPVQVQGKTAAFEIAAAIEVANQYFQDMVDVLIVGRGGGSVEDLWAFNEEVVARAIYASHIPIISAVGHEVDWTIADYVADYRAPTPTAAAEHLMKEIITQNRTLQYYASTLWNTLDNRFRLVSQRLTNANPTALFHLTETRFQNTKKQLHNHLIRMSLPLQHKIEKYSFHLDKLSENILSLYHARLQKAHHTLSLLGEKLTKLNPQKILERGFSLTFIQTKTGEKLLRSPHEAPEGSLLRTQLATGDVFSEVTPTTQ